MRHVRGDHQNLARAHHDFFSLDGKFQRAFQNVGDLLIFMAVHRHDAAGAQKKPRQHALLAGNELTVNQRI